jgi:hypothetical protein
MLFKEIIPVYINNHIMQLVTAKAGGTYSYQWDLKG